MYTLLFAWYGNIGDIVALYKREWNTDHAHLETSTQRKRQRGLSMLRLKIIAMVLLTLGTLNTAVVMPHIDMNNIGDLTLAILLDAVSWVAIPIFAWITVMGVHYSQHLWHYLGRVLLLAVLSEVPYDMATSHVWFDSTSNNPIWAVAVCIVVIAVLRSLDTRPVHDAYTGPVYQVSYGQSVGIRIVVCIAAVLWLIFGHFGMRAGIMNEGLVLLAMVIIFEILHRHENTMMYSAAVVGALAGLTPGLGVVVVHYHNDQLGYTKKAVGLGFYAYYVVHLVLFAVLAVLA